MQNRPHWEDLCGTEPTKTTLQERGWEGRPQHQSTPCLGSQVGHLLAKLHKKAAFTIPPMSHTGQAPKVEIRWRKVKSGCRRAKRRYSPNTAIKIQ